MTVYELVESLLECDPKSKVVMDGSLSGRFQSVKIVSHVEIVPEAGRDGQEYVDVHHKPGCQSEKAICLC